MKTFRRAIIQLPALVILLANVHSASAQGTAFTYQGRLTDGGYAANGVYDLRFALYNAATGGSQQGPLLTNGVTGVSNGLFIVMLDFGNQFPGADRWLEIAVRTNGGGAFTNLNPRQKLSPTPYAVTAANLGGALPAGQLSGAVPSANLSGTYANALTFNNAGNSFNGNGAGLTALNASQLTSGTVPDAQLAGNVARTNQVWLLRGNSGTTAGTHFVGTTDNQPLELQVNGMRALRLEPNTNGAPNLVGGSSVNFVAPGVTGATISGGGAINYFGASYTNSVAGDFGAIGGGYFNAIQTGASAATIGGGGANGIQSYVGYSTIGGGEANVIQTSADHATIGGGYANTIQTLAYDSTIGGGNGNTIQVNAYRSTIGGGNQNTIQHTAIRSMIGGGYGNTIQTLAYDSTIGGGGANGIQSYANGSTIGGGYQNMIQSNAFYSTISGGYVNTVSGTYGVVPGGDRNLAGNYAFAAGRRAKAIHMGSFVWADSTDADFASTGNNQFLIRASGGTYIQGADRWDVNNTEGDLRIGGDTYRFKIGVAQGGGGAGDTWMRVHGGTGRLFLKTPGGTTLYSNEGQTTGVTLAAGGGSWTSLSDRNAKENFAPVDALEVLAKVAALPLTSWNYKAQDEGIRHLGPMAQDFKAAFGLGESETGITGVDADGVALAAIQGLNKKVERENTSLRAENAELKARLDKLEQLIHRLTGSGQ